MYPLVFMYCTDCNTRLELNHHYMKWNLPKSLENSQSIVLGILPASFWLSDIISCTLFFKNGKNRIIIKYKLNFAKPCTVHIFNWRMYLKYSLNLDIHISYMKYVILPNRIIQIIVHIKRLCAFVHCHNWRVLSLFIQF